MPFISVTRLRPRSIRFLLPIALHTIRTRRQLRAANDFLGGYLAIGPKLTLWTVTAWTDEAAMRAFRNTGEHLRAMPQLIGSCDEASVVHWTVESETIPEPAEAAAKMANGRLSKVRYPSADHAAGLPWPDRRVPRKGTVL